MLPRLAGVVLVVSLLAVAGGPVDPRDAFVRCPDSTRLGQTKPAGGVTCAQACKAFGLACLHRAAQADLSACTPSSPERSGSCADVFAPGWSSQCVCEPRVRCKRGVCTTTSAPD
ncbi:MAG: hypothetical protein JNJ54_19175 [Myxococcaceae bacterium]|nr:hypothetical protein [Myxococcaceae bacterium]